MKLSHILLIEREKDLEKGVMDECPVISELWQGVSENGRWFIPKRGPTLGGWKASIDGESRFWYRAITRLKVPSRS
jgi:hypothetical protein